ncbi:MULTISPECIES: efflux RND transporter periplasmic adaptor subunit [Rhodomicrobium]|uniref:efflux RND transporter periplasmic adaptor subunit n=1 Tax=Rhodomicrobium TaxID=1068 RepID=UPI000B4B4C16|nr:MULTISPECIES: efflux RND transporter periplasmic adaptor subunit [Rhodomicrobium]
MTRLISARALAPLCAVLALAACNDSQPTAQSPAPPPPQVTVATPVKKLVTEQDEYVGRFVAVDSVEVRARVSGYLDAIHFKDGQLVKKGDLLFTIDRRPFETSLLQAQAGLAQAQANLAYAQSDLARGQNLVRGSTITEQTYDQRTQAKAVAEASVAAQEAAIRQAQLDLDFTELRAPVSGRIGDRRVSIGNLVTGGTGGTTLLATIVSTDPIRFEFTFDEASYLRYTRAAKDGGSASRGVALPVKLRLIDETAFTHEGKMDFIDNTIDQTSGTIRGRAEFANPDGRFTPGLFARIQLPAGPPVESLLVPDVAIGTEQVRKIVLVVDADNVVRSKYVTLGSVVDGMRVITAGLSPDDRVIVNGLMRARAGAKVTPQEAGAPAPAPASAGAAKAQTN